jgi:ribonuclease P protein component
MFYKKIWEKYGQRMSSDEAHLSTAQLAPGPNPRFYEPDEHSRRPPGLETPSDQGAQAPHGLSGLGAPLSHAPLEPQGPAPSQTRPSPGKARLSKADKLRRRREFLRVQAAGRRLFTPHFHIWLAPGTREAPRLGLVVTRRLGKAVRRNRVKRLLREFFRRHKQQLPPLDLVIMARKGAEALGYQQVQEELARVLLPPGKDQAIPR